MANVKGTIGLAASRATVGTSPLAASNGDNNKKPKKKGIDKSKLKKSDVFAPPLPTAISLAAQYGTTLAGKVKYNKIPLMKYTPPKPDWGRKRAKIHMKIRPVMVVESFAAKMNIPE